VATLPGGEVLAAWWEHSPTEWALEFYPSELFWSRRLPQGLWAKPQLVAPGTFDGPSKLRLAAKSDGSALLVWSDAERALAATIAAGEQAWTKPQTLSPQDFHISDVEPGLGGVVHVVGVQGSSTYPGARVPTHARLEGGALVQTQPLRAPVAEPGGYLASGAADPKLITQPNGGLAALWWENETSATYSNGYDLWMSSINSDGSWSQAQEVAGPPDQMLPTGDGFSANPEGIHAVYADQRHNEGKSSGHLWWSVLNGDPDLSAPRRISGVSDAVGPALVASPAGVLLLSWTNHQDVGEAVMTRAAVRSPGAEWRFAPPLRLTHEPAGGFLGETPFVMSVSGTGSRCSEVTFRQLAPARPS
jgi:hypothetical protein